VSEKREPGFDRALALVLRIGAFAGFFVMLAGVVAHIFVDGVISARIELAGVLIMLVTPVVRVLVAMVLFFREKDWRYGWISAGVLLILLLGSVFGIGEGSR
jgi:uncharacterized membrane protein